MLNYEGQCHCGAVQFAVEIRDFDCWECNCSLCIRTGAIYHRVDASAFTITAGQDHLINYGSRDFVVHKFCKKCHITCCSEVTFADEQLVCVNLRCCPDVDLRQLAIERFSGASTF